MILFKYNPLKTKYKSVVGAVEVGSELSITLLASKELHLDRVSLVVKPDQTNVQLRYAMDLKGTEGRYNAFSATVRFDEVGLFWYNFEVSAFDVTARVGIDCNRNTRLYYSDAPYYQLSVFKHEYDSPDWLQDGVMYQIFPDRFFREDAVQTISEGRILRSDWGGQPCYKPVNGRVMCNDFFGGNLKGIVAKLDYLKSLNVTSIYLNPIFRAYSNHRYDTEDYEQVDPLLGSNDDFAILCDKAREKGIRIILDGVFNHSGADSKYFNRAGKYNTVGAYQSRLSPYFDWYNFADYDKKKYLSWWGVDTLPSHNPDSKSLQEYFCSDNGIVAKWLKMGASGWRLDVVDEIKDVMLDRIVSSAKKAKHDSAIIGEVWEDATNKIAYGQRRRYFLGGQLDSVMNYCLKDALIDFVRNGNVNRLKGVMFDILNNYPKKVVNNLMCLIDSHDTARALTAISNQVYAPNTPKEVYADRRLTGEEYNRAVYLLKMCVLLQYTMIGFPCVFYGDEVGVQGYGDPFCRACFPWNNIDYDLYGYYKYVGSFRNLSALRNGDFAFVTADNGQLVFTRSNEEMTILVGVNRGKDFTLKLDCDYLDLFANTVCKKGDFFFAKDTFFIFKKI